MIFSHLARILAVLGIAIGSLFVVMGFLFAQENMDPTVVRVRYGSSPGEMIDKGALAIFIAIALGTLAEISFAVRKRSE